MQSGSPDVTFAFRSKYRCYFDLLLFRGGQNEMKFEDLLVFITGADEVAVLGSRGKLCMDFYEKAEGMHRLP